MCGSWSPTVCSLVSEIIPPPMSRVVAGMTCHHITNYSYYKIHAPCFSLGNQLWYTCQSFTQCQTTAIFRTYCSSQDSQHLWLRVFKAVHSDEEKEACREGWEGVRDRSSSPVDAEACMGSPYMAVLLHLSMLLMRMADQVSSSRGHQMSLQMIVSHHMVAGN